MRITGGSARSIPLRTGQSNSIRPATDRMRESVFSSLGPLVEGTACLDLFAGTGSYGLEALSRGAENITFVEKDGRSFAALKQNFAAVEKSLGQRSLSQLKKTDVTKLASDSFTGLDLIFIDPPYPLWDELMVRLSPLLKNWLAPSSSSRLILEAPGGKVIEIPGFEILKKLGGKKQHDPGVWILALKNS